jgi:hypothetical protein
MRNDDNKINEIIEEAGWRSRQRARLSGMSRATKQAIGDVATAISGTQPASDAGWRGKYALGKQDRILNTLSKDIIRDLTKLGLLPKNGSPVQPDQLKKMLNGFLSNYTGVGRNQTSPTQPNTPQAPQSFAPSTPAASVPSTPAASVPSTPASATSSPLKPVSASSTTTTTSMQSAPTSTTPSSSGKTKLPPVRSGSSLPFSQRPSTPSTPPQSAASTPSVPASSTTSSSSTPPAPSTPPSAPPSPAASTPSTPSEPDSSSTSTPADADEPDEDIPDGATIKDKNNTTYEYDSEDKKWWIPSGKGGSLNAIPNDRPQLQDFISSAWQKQNKKQKKKAKEESEKLPAFESFKNFFLNKN